MMSGPSWPRPSGHAPLPSGSSGTDEWPPPRPDITARRAYSPLKDLGALEWKTQNPAYDGRGVTIAAASAKKPASGLLHWTVDTGG